MRRDSVDLRVLLVAGPDEDPTTTAWIRELTSVGVPFDVARPTRAQPLRFSDLIDPEDSHRGRYNGIVLGTDSSVFWSAIDDLIAYRKRFHVRQLDGFQYPQRIFGLEPRCSQRMDGVVASVTTQGERVFRYLTGTIPLDAGCFGHLSATVRDEAFSTYVEGPDGAPVIGVFTSNGLEEMVVTVNYNEMMLHWRLLCRGLLAWVTRNCHFGMSHNYLTLHVDDVFLSNWSVPDAAIGNRESEVDTVRMTRDDVDAVVAWQRQRRFTLDLAYNGVGAQNATMDGLTAALLKHKTEFRWINHTWSHLDLDAQTIDGQTVAWPDTSAICQEICRNREWAASVGLAVSPTALITGAHSGLSNPYMSAAVKSSGVTVMATDASRSPHLAALGSAVILPRHPANIYTHSSTWPKLLKEYNGMYSTNGQNAVSREQFLEIESQIVLRRVLSNDPCPTFAHQSNLTGDRVLLELLNHLLGWYARHISDNCPLLTVSMEEAATELLRRERYWRALQKGKVKGHTRGDELIITSAWNIDVPLTVPYGTSHKSWRHRRLFGTPYGGSTSAWVRVGAGEALRLFLPRWSTWEHTYILSPARGATN